MQLQLRILADKYRHYLSYTLVALAITDQELKTDSIRFDFTTIISNIFGKISGCKGNDILVNLYYHLFNIKLKLYSF